MADLGGVTAITVDGRARTWAEVWRHARRTGAWDRLERRVGGGLALRRAGHVPEPADVRAHTEAFRRERRLHAAEDAEAWLAARGLTVAELVEHAGREALLARLGPVEPVRAARTRELEVTGWCSPAFDDMARDLALELVGVAGTAPTERELEALVERRRLDWVQVEADAVVARHEDAAREVAQCIVADGMTVREVARLAGGTTLRLAGFLEDLPAPVRPALLAGLAGEVVGPVPADGIGPATVEGVAPARSACVLLVRRKRLPTLADRRVAERARREVAEARAAQALADRVRWHEPR